MNTKKYALVVLSILMILLVFISTASAADTNKTTEVLSVDESSNIETNLLSTDNNVKSNELSNDTLKVSNDEVLTAENNNWYVNGSKTSSGNGTSGAEAFKTLNEALNAAQAGETIMIASGEYKGTNNTGLTISKNLNFIKYGDGEAIFDAESQNRIWDVEATSININGLTFKNGKTQGETDGGAIWFTKDISNSNINATFINNEARHGGAIHTDKLFSCNLNGTFINNKATGYFGGAIDIRNFISGKLTGTFINNKAEKYGGAIFCFDVSGNVNGTFINNTATSEGGSAIQCNGGGSGTLSGTFINNTGAKSAIYISNEFTGGIFSGTLSGTFINNTATDSQGGAIDIDGQIGANGIIKDAVFINNNIYSKKSKITATNCWFGNNATNYNATPDAGTNVTLPNWLFLNATSNQSEVNLGQNSTITFKLDSYNSTSKTTNLYNASKINAAVSLTQTLGELDKTTALFDEKIIYTAKKPGKASITGKFETVTYTINFKNTRDSITWYVNGSKTSSGNGTSDEEAFKTLKEALNETIDYDTIMIASGEYKGTDNTGLTIDKNLTIMKYGDGEAIFDAESKNGIWYVNATSINITDITFKNGNATSGGALHFENSLIDSNINATFINNNATDELLGGGAIYIDEDYSGNLTGIFINNTASYCGGAIYCQHLSGNLTGTFINNTGTHGGAIYIYNTSGNISGTFINNTENNNPVAIYIYGDSSNPTAKIKDAIFINNNIYSKENKITATNCWFGNNATNYNATPDAGTNVTLHNWLFLNATADPAEVPLGQNSTITFKLDSYNSTSKTTNSYDASKINAAVSLTQTLGELDKTTALFDEKIIYTAKKPGKASITGKFETLEYTINLKNTRDSITWYVNGSKTSSGNGTSDAEAFKTLKEALNETIDYDTIMIASGEYKGTNNTELTIDKNLTFIKYGDGEAIFDAESQRRIWYVPATSINITGLTFKNGKTSGNGGALYFVNSLTNSNINATFINNTAPSSFAYGGAIRINGNFSGNIIGTFINNIADHYGGAICIYGNYSGNIRGTFINNTANSGAIYICNSSGNISGTFINNTAYHGAAIDCDYLSGNVDGTFINNRAKGETGGAIYIYNGKELPTSGNISGTFINNTAKHGPVAIFIYGNSFNPSAKIKDAVFINNNIEVRENKITATNCWFGNNATNYNQAPDAGINVNLTNWLFLNATASPGEIKVNEKSTIKFILESYDETSKQTNTYDASKMNIILNLTQTLGKLDKTTALIDKNVSYTAKEEGNASVTGKFETAFYTINLKNEGVAPIPTNITLNTTSLNLIIGENGTIVASLDPPEAGNLTYTSNDTNIATVNKNGTVTAITNGTALITVSFPGNKDYTAAENKTLTVTVSEKPIQIPTNITLNTTSLNLNVSENGTIIASLNPPEAGNLTYTSNDTNIATVDEYGVVTAKGNGTALITVSFGGNGQYLPAENKTLTVTVNKKPGPIPTNITLNTTSLNLNVSENGTIIASLNPPEAGNLTYTSNDTNIATVDEYGVVTAKGNGTALITVSFGGNGQYLPAENKTLTVTVNKKPGPIPTNITLNTTSLNLNVSENGTIIASLNPPEAGNLTYTSNDTNIATVDEYGVVTAKGNGTALITVSFGGNGQYLPAENKTVIVTVGEKPGPIPTNITLNTTSLSLIVGENGTIVASLNPPKAGNLTYTSNDTNIATVDEYGVVTAKGNGTALITVSFPGNKDYAAAKNKTLTVTVSEKPAIPTNITLNTTSLNLIIGDNGTIIASLNPPEAGNLTYTSNDTNIATVDKNGIVTAIANGTALITVSFPGNKDYAAAKNKTVTVTVNLKDASVSVNNNTLDLKVKDNFTIIATTTPGGLNVTYTSSNESVATVDAQGNVKAVGAGIAFITVSVGGDGTYALNTTTVKVTVNKIPTEINITNTTVDMEVNDEVSTGATLTPADAGNVTYTISNSTVVKIKDGKIIALSEGTANITVSFNGNEQYAPAKNKTITITVNLKDASVSVNNNTLDLKVNDNFTIIATTTPDGLNVTYTSSNESVATVDTEGNVKAVGAGTAIITVSVGGDGTYALNTTTVTVTVNKIPTEINITNTTVTLNVDDEISTGATLTPADAGNLTYTSSNPDVAIVENGIIKALKEGTAIITVSYNGNDKYAPAENKTIFVTVSKIPTNITIDNSTLNLNVGDSVLTGATLYPVGAGNLTYNSTNSEIAIVENGIIKALKEGIAIITVSFNGNEKYASADDKFIFVHIAKMNPIVNATSISFIVGNEGILNIYGPKDEYGYINVTINNIIYQTIIKDGIASLNVSNLDIGVYSVDILYAENARYYQKEFTNAAQIIVFDKFPTPLNVDDLSIHVDDIAVINVYGLPNSLNGRNITITINNKTQIAIISDGNASSSFSDLTAGNYEIIVSYDGDNIYKANSTKANLTVNKISPNVNADDIEFKLGNEGILIITGPNDREGNLFINIGDNTYKATLINGEAKINVSHLNIGTYTVDIVYLENDKYYGEEFPNIAQITVIDKFPTPLKVDDLNINIGEDANIRVYNIPEDLNGKIITIAIEGVGSHFAVIRNGEAYSTFRGLTKTSYVIVASYSGDDNYKANSTKAILNVIKFIPKVSASNVTFIIGNEATLNIIGPDDYPGNLNITIGNNTYTATLINGSANINISDLGVGQYNVNILYLENDKYYEWYFENIATINVLDKIPTPLKIDDLTINAGEIADVNVTVPLSINGQSIIISVNSKVVESIIINGIANAKFSDLPDGQYPIIAYYPGDSTHAANMTVATLNVNPKEKENATISIDAPTEATEGNDVPVTVTLPEDATGTVTIGNEAVPIINGTAKTVLTNIPAGNTTVPITYSGDNKYNPIETEISINVKESINIDAPDVTKYYHGPERLVITVTDSEGTPIANKPVSIIINGVTNNRTTNAKGTTSIAINLPSNLYNATITVDNKSINSVILVLPTVNGTDLVKVFRNATQYYATFLDSEGNYLQEGSIVRFNINGVMYDRKVTSNGLAKLNINLEQGEYIITAMNPETGEMASNKITVIPRIIENNDLTKYYRNASQYTVKIIGDDGKAVGAGVTVTFNINGVFYTRQTNALGIAKLNINLEPGTYIITAEYQGCKVSNIIQVLPVLTAADMVKNYDTPDQFVATLVDGEGYPYAGQTVHFNIHGVLYTRVTDIIGQARLNINLQPGEYIITSSYNGSSISNKITIIG